MCGRSFQQVIFIVRLRPLPQTDPDSNLGNPGAGAPFEQSNRGWGGKAHLNASKRWQGKRLKISPNIHGKGHLQSAFGNCRILRVSSLFTSFCYPTLVASSQIFIREIAILNHESGNFHVQYTNESWSLFMCLKHFKIFGVAG